MVALCMEWMALSLMSARDEAAENVDTTGSGRTKSNIKSLLLDHVDVCVTLLAHRRLASLTFLQGIVLVTKFKVALSTSP